MIIYLKSALNASLFIKHYLWGMTHEESLITHMVSQLPGRRGWLSLELPWQNTITVPAVRDLQGATETKVIFAAGGEPSSLGSKRSALHPNGNLPWAIQQRHPVNRFILEALRNRLSQETWRGISGHTSPTILSRTYAWALGNKGRQGDITVVERLALGMRGLCLVSSVRKCLI